MKTTNHVFPASYVDAGHLPALGGTTLKYNGKEYMLADALLPQLTDKTVNDRYFNLTLFAIGKELLSREASSGVVFMPDEVISVTLLIGLPLSHCKELGEKYAKYLKPNKAIKFEISTNAGKRRFGIFINEVKYYPQGISAAFTIRDKIKDSRTVNIVDVGGYTADCVRLATVIIKRELQGFIDVNMKVRTAPLFLLSSGNYSYSWDNMIIVEANNDPEYPSISLAIRDNDEEEQQLALFEMTPNMPKSGAHTLRMLVWRGGVDEDDYTDAFTLDILRKESKEVTWEKYQSYVQKWVETYKTHTFDNSPMTFDEWLNGDSEDGWNAAPIGCIPCTWLSDTE